MLARFVLACVLAAVPLVSGQEQEKPKPVPKDSLRVVITGCVRGRVIRAADVRQTDASSGIDIRSKTFRLQGNKDAMKSVKEVDGERAEITGLIKKSALIQNGMSVAGGRVRIGGTNGSPNSLPDPAQDVAVLDIESVRALGGSCAT